MYLNADSNNYSQNLNVGGKFLPEHEISRWRTGDSISRMKRWRAAANGDGRKGDRCKWRRRWQRVTPWPFPGAGSASLLYAHDFPNRSPPTSTGPLYASRYSRDITGVLYHLTRPLFQYVGWFSMPYCNANLLGWSIVFVMWCLVMRTTAFRKLRSCIVDLTSTNWLAELFNSFYYT